MPAKKTTKKTAPAAEAATEEVTNNEVVEVTEAPAAEAATEEDTEAMVYDNRQRLVRTFTLAEHGKDFVEQAKALATQPRRTGWRVTVR